MIEKSLILVKHDGVSRGLVGEIIGRFEKVGLKIVGMKMLLADENMARKHYKVDKDWAKNVFEKTKITYEKEGKNFAFTNPLEFGKLIQGWNVKFLKEGPVIAFVVEGPSAVEIVRKIVGNTEPKQASPGTIRGDFAMIESYMLADKKQRVLRNLVHASDSKENAEREMQLWFSEDEIYDYEKDLDKYF